MDEWASKQAEQTKPEKLARKSKGVTKFMISSHKGANYDLK